MQGETIKINNKYKAVNRLDTDFKAETVAAGLIESGFDANKILIVRKTGNKRHVSKDIASLENVFSQQDLMEYLYIYTNRSCIYEAIPENVFHQPLNTAKKKTQDDVVKEIRRHRQEEFYARRFFQPFEMVVDKLLIDVHVYECKFDKKNFYSNLKDILSRHAPILKLMTLRQAVFFIKVIPVLRQTTKDLSLLGQILGIILDAPVRVEIGKPSTIEVANPSTIVDNKWILGINSVLGDTLKDGYRDIDIQIGPMDPDQIISYYPGRENEMLLKKLLSMTLPANMKRNITFETTRQLSGFRLSDNTHSAYLGINTDL